MFGRISGFCIKKTGICTAHDGRINSRRMKKDSQIIGFRSFIPVNIRNFVTQSYRLGMEREHGVSCKTNQTR